jgi:hypothetical protein
VNKQAKRERKAARKAEREAAAPAPSQSAPVQADTPARAPLKISINVLAASRARSAAAVATPWVIPKPPPGMLPSEGASMAQDADIGGIYGWAAGYGGTGGLAEGLYFPGYPYLAELTQRPEYRRGSEIIAKEMTRAWLELTSSGDDDNTKKLAAINAEMTRLGVQDAFRRAAEHDGFFGKGQIYLDTGDTGNPDELKVPLLVDKAKIKPGGLKRLVVVEPVWTYPAGYSTTDPLRPDYFKPQAWYTMGKAVHASRWLTFVAREMPDILKPAYAFGGLSLSQMGKAYVDNWLATRQSVADLIRSFSVSGIKTNMGAVLTGGSNTGLLDRVALFGNLRDNSGTMLLDKETEEFFNVATPLGTLDALQAQTQEHMCLSLGTLVETDRGQVPVEDVTDCDLVMTRNGYAPVAWVGVTKYVSSFVEIETDVSTIRVTEEHPVWSETKGGFVSARNVDRTHRLRKSPAWANMDDQSRGAAVCGAAQTSGIIETLRRAACCTASYTKHISAPSRWVSTFITWTKTRAIMCLPIWRRFRDQIITASMNQRGFIDSSIGSTRNDALCVESHFLHAGRIAPFAVPTGASRGATNCATKTTWGGLKSEKPTKTPTTSGDDLARVLRVRKVDCGAPEPVYDITVADGFLPEFYANGILVHNSSVWGIPLIVFFGIVPHGLNASSDGEIAAWNAWVHAQQEHLFNAPVARLLQIIQLSLFGVIDPGIGHKWVPLGKAGETAAAAIRKSDADTAAVYIAAGVLFPEEERTRLAAAEGSLYSGIDVDEVPEVPGEGDPGDDTGDVPGLEDAA